MVSLLQRTPASLPDPHRQRLHGRETDVSALERHYPQVHPNPCRGGGAFSWDPQPPQPQPLRLQGRHHLEAFHLQP